MRYFTTEELKALRVKFEKHNDFDRTSEMSMVKCRTFSHDPDSETDPPRYYDIEIQARWDGYMDCTYQLKNEYEFFQLRAATGDLEDFGDAARLVGDVSQKLDKIVVEEYNANIKPLVPQPGVIWG